MRPQCIVCGALAPARGGIPAGRTCASCRAGSAVAVFLSPFLYEDEVVQRLVRAFKYRRVRDLGSVGGEILCAWIRDHGIRFPAESVIVPVPLSPVRMRVRGFNQASLLAEGVSACTGIPLAPDILLRSRTVRAQAQLSGQERKQNVAGTFSVRHAEEIFGKTIVVIDDVKTTGATLEEAARCLRAAGAKNVWAIALAH